jgi:hypothetical protein
LRRNAEGICNAIEEGKHCGDINSFSNLRFGPTVIPQFLHIFAGRAVRRLSDLGDVIKQCTFRRAQSRFLKIAICDGLYGFVFGSLNTQEVCM